MKIVMDSQSREIMCLNCQKKIDISVVRKHYAKNPLCKQVLSKHDVLPNAPAHYKLQFVWPEWHFMRVNLDRSIEYMCAQILVRQTINSDLSGAAIVWIHIEGQAVLTSFLWTSWGGIKMTGSFFPQKTSW